jgi:anti-anti-sigma regulatory factor
MKDLPKPADRGADVRSEMSQPNTITQLRTSDGVLVVSVAAGHLASIDAVARFERELRQLLRDRTERLWLIDFGGTTFFITPAVNTLLAVLRTLRERGGRLVLTGVSQDVRHILSLLRLNRLLTLSANIAAGMAELGLESSGQASEPSAEAG